MFGRDLFLVLDEFNGFKREGMRHYCYQKQNEKKEVKRFYFLGKFLFMVKTSLETSRVELSSDLFEVS